MIVDCHLPVSFGNETAITDRMSAAWRDYLGPATVLVDPPALANPLGSYRDEAYRPDGERPGSDLRGTIERHLDAHRITRALVAHDAGQSLAALPNHRLAAAAVDAANRWMLEEVLSVDERLHGTLLVAPHTAAGAARTIREAADESRWAAVALAANNLGQPFGHPAYHEIYAAAAETGLTVVLDHRTDAWLDVASNPTGLRASTYADLYALSSQSIAAHLLSLIGEGVLERWPDLKLFAVGAGVTWLTPELWRFDSNFKAFYRDAPQLSLLPSEYIERNVRIGTYPFDRFASAGQLERYLAVEPGLERLLCYASGYPAWDAQPPSVLSDGVPAAWADRVLAGNALEAFRWSATDASGRPRAEATR